MWHNEALNQKCNLLCWTKTSKNKQIEPSDPQTSNFSFFRLVQDSKPNILLLGVSRFSSRLSDIFQCPWARHFIPLTLAESDPVLPVHTSSHQTTQSWPTKQGRVNGFPSSSCSQSIYIFTSASSSLPLALARRSNRVLFACGVQSAVWLCAAPPRNQLGVDGSDSH